MKKVMVLSVLLLCATIAKAQDTEKNEVRIGFSDATFIQLGDGFADAFSTAIVSGISGVKYKDAKNKTTGMFEAGYRYAVKERVKVGADISYMKSEDTFTANIANAKSVTRNTNYIMALVMGEYSYIKTPLLNFYGSGGLGILSGSTKETGGSYSHSEVGFAYQINPAGLRVGKKLGGFVELGYGYKGIATAGINYKF
ncbi:MAG: outer membrane beta-barrel protein [Flavobacterium circumlabens]|uniref:outer membrane beta-barrel protein n=1 Tax=Flavobacterium circumlabens TaxID=2133765 RepID=UPI0032672905